MAYTKTVWKNNQPPALNETNLNKIEEGVFEAHGLVEDLTTGHKHTGTDSRKVAHSDLEGITANDHHAKIHATSHQDGGEDEINVTGLSGELSDSQKPKFNHSVIELLVTNTGIESLKRKKDHNEVASRIRNGASDFFVDESFVDTTNSENLTYDSTNKNYWFGSLKTWTSKSDWEAGLVKSFLDSVSSPGDLKIKSYEDDFDDNVIDTEKWNIIGDPADIKEQNQRLEISVTGKTSPTETSLTQGNKITVTGDFDVQVDWNFAPAAINSSTALLMFVVDSNNLCYLSRRYDLDKHYMYSSIKVAGVTYDDTDFLTETSGKYRIVRSGSTLTLYYDVGAGWVQTLQRTDFSTADGFFKLQTNIWNANPDLSCWFDNFVFNAGNKYFPSAEWKGSITPKAGVTQDWKEATIDKTEPDANHTISVTYSADDATYYSDIASVPNSETLFVKASFTGNESNTPVLHSIEVKWVSPGTGKLLTILDLVNLMAT